MTRVKRRNLQKVKAWLREHQGEEFIALDISNDVGLSPLQLGMIVSLCCHGLIDHVGYERVLNNIYARKVYKVRYFE